jgi:hypothetical protein
MLTFLVIPDPVSITGQALMGLYFTNVNVESGIIFKFLDYRVPRLCAV